MYAGGITACINSKRVALWTDAAATKPGADAHCKAKMGDAASLAVLETPEEWEIAMEMLRRVGVSDVGT